MLRKLTSRVFERLFYSFFEPHYNIRERGNSINKVSFLTGCILFPLMGSKIKNDSTSHGLSDKTRYRFKNLTKMHFMGRVFLKKKNKKQQQNVLIFSQIIFIFCVCSPRKILKKGRKEKDRKQNGKSHRKQAHRASVRHVRPSSQQRATCGFLAHSTTESHVRSPYPVKVLVLSI